jgi:serine/threonine protein kinase
MLSKENKSITYLPGDLVLNRYQIKSKIGEGGMNSIVYLAEDMQVNDNEYFAVANKFVAIKVINRDKTVDDDL